MNDSELLRELLGCFFESEPGCLEWGYRDGHSVGSILGDEIEKRLVAIRSESLNKEKED